MTQLLLLFSLLSPQVAMQAHAAQPKTVSTLNGAQIQALFPATVYFSGQTTTVQLRNSGGVHWAEDKQSLFGIVDTGGYSSAMEQRYQFYILTDVPIEIDGKLLPSGAYGAGFMTGTGFEVMDIGGTELFHAPFSHDASMQRPRPLQVTSAGNARFRLYLGRNYVEFSLVKR